MTQKFKKLLEEKGVVDTRASDFAYALDKLHDALCKLDLEHREIVGRSTLPYWLTLYARTEGYLDIVAELWKERKEEGGE